MLQELTVKCLVPAGMVSFASCSATGTLYIGKHNYKLSFYRYHKLCNSEVSNWPMPRSLSVLPLQLLILSFATQSSLLQKQERKK